MDLRQPPSIVVWEENDPNDTAWKYAASTAGVPAKSHVYLIAYGPTPGEAASKLYDGLVELGWITDEAIVEVLDESGQIDHI